MKDGSVHLVDWFFCYTTLLNLMNVALIAAFWGQEQEALTRVRLKTEFFGAQALSLRDGVMESPSSSESLAW